MDVHSERRHTQLKKKLEALRYTQPLSADSSPLVEKLLNDYLKATEAFNKLKKINDGLKSQIGAESGYQEPLKAENERVVRECNELHQQLIDVKETADKERRVLQDQMRQLDSEKTDLQFVVSQHEHQLSENRREMTSMQHRLIEAMKASQCRESTAISRVFTPQDKNLQERAATFTLSSTVEAGAPVLTREQEASKQELWAQEVRRADERADKFKKENDDLQAKMQRADEDIAELKSLIATRDAEIQRLQASYVGGQTFSAVKRDADDVAKIQSENQAMCARFEDIANMLDVKDFRLGGYSQARLDELLEQVTLVRQRLDDGAEDRATLERQLERVRNQAFNEAMQGKLVADTDNTESRLRDAEAKADALERDNRTLRSQMENKVNVESAFQSNNRAFIERLSDVERELQTKDDAILAMQRERADEQADHQRLVDELNMYKGRCQSLLRDIDMHSGAVNKLSTDAGSMGEQLGIYRSRISDLEEELAKEKTNGTDLTFEVKRLTTEKDRLNDRLAKVTADSLKSQGEGVSSGATIARLQAQIQKQSSDYELVFAQKNELEKLVKDTRDQVLEAERKSTDYYNQLLGTRENFQIMHNEQQLLSEELTEKQKELTKAEREKLNLERELLQLRPLQGHASNFEESNRAQIEANVRVEFEKNKLQKQVMEMQQDSERQRTDYDAIVAQNKELTSKNQALLLQLSQFEKQSFEIEARIKRGLDVENENRVIDGQLVAAKDAERAAARQIDGLQQHATLKASELDRATARADSLQMQVKTLEDDIGAMRGKMAELQQQLHEGATETMKQEHRRNQQEVELYDAKSQNQQLREQLTAQGNELAAARKDLGDSQLRNQTLGQQVERLKSLVENLDSNKEELIKRLQAVANDKNSELSDKAILQNDIANYKKELLAKDGTIQQLKENIASLDGQLDDMQQELDEKTEDLLGCKQRLEKQTFEFSNMQHQVSVVTGKEDDFQRRLFEREQELTRLRQEYGATKEQLEQSSQIIQVKTQECAELTEDIQTLTRENKHVNAEFAKATQASEFLKRQSDHLGEQERMAQQSVRALEIEKQDVLQNYRDACAESERHQEATRQLQDEHNKLYQRCLDMEKNAGGSVFAIKELQTKEQNYIAEIKTLERHIDHLTHQLELAHKAMRETQEERDRMNVELNNQRQFNVSQENGQESLQRMCSQLEQDKQFMQQQISDLRIESDALRQQIEYDKQQQQDLEMLIQKERQFNHEHSLGQGELARKNQELTADLERSKSRVQTLQQHIETLSRYNTAVPTIGGSSVADPTGRSSEDLLQAHETINKLQQENAQSQQYIQQYESRIKDLEQEIEGLGVDNE